MAREYFPHDYNTRNKLKMAAMTHEFGNRGYGLFWMIVEILHEEESHWLELQQYTYVSLAKQTSEDVDYIKSFIEKCISDFKIFIQNEDKFTTDRVLRNVDRRNEISEKRSKAGKASAIAKHVSTSVEQNSTNKRKLNRKEIKETEINIQFSDFWRLYDKKVGSKDKLEKKWQNLTDEERIKALNFIPFYVKETPDKKYRKNPETFLNNKSWNDELSEKVIPMGAELKKMIM